MNPSFSNHQFLPADQVSINVSDLGLLRSYGVFDALRTYHGKMFLFDEHLKRLKNSAEIAGLKLPITDSEIKGITLKLLAKNGFQESSIKIILIAAAEGEEKAKLHILIEELKPHPQRLYTNGIKLVIHPHQRELPKAKSLNYLTAMALEPWQKEQGAFEILYTHHGKILEASTSNFFIFRGNTLITPKEDILTGITRNFVLQIAREHFEVKEREVKISELQLATEAFITATKKEIMPVVRIDDQLIGNGKPGENTKKLMKIFREKTALFS